MAEDTAPAEPTLTLAELEQLVEGERIVPTRLGRIRIERLEMRRKLELLRLLDTFERRADQQLADADAFQFGLELIARAATEPSGAPLFKGAAGRRILERMDPQDLQPLIEAAAAINGFEIEGAADPN